MSLSGYPTSSTAARGSLFGLPTGTVVFFGGSTPLGTEPVVCGSAAPLTLEDSESAGVGPNTITAQYVGSTRLRGQAPPR